MIGKEFPNRHKPVAWKLLGLVAGIVIVFSLWLGSTWQNQVRTLVGEQPLESHHVIRIAIIAAILSLLIILIARGVRRSYRMLFHFMSRFVPKNVSKVIAYGFVALFFYWILSGVLLNGFIDISNNVYRKKNQSTPAGISQPTSPYRSGSPASLVPWETLGYQGKAFVARGPSQEQLSAYTGGPVSQQIRTYVGLDSAATATERANLAIKELERTNAFSRKVLVLATATGTGWLEPQSVDAIEYMYGGDTAIVSQQY